MTRRTAGWLRKTAGVLGTAALLLVAACAAEPQNDGSGSTIAMPQRWDAIDLGDADLNLPLVAPLEVASLGKRIGEGQVFDNLYTFHGVKGFVLTSRVALGSFSERYSKTLRDMADFRAFAGELSLPPGGTVTLLDARAFLNGQPLTRGFVAEAAVPPYQDNCFVARVGYLSFDYASVKRDPDAIDTVVEAFLCGDLPRHTALLDMMTKLRAVDDRAAFRRALARSPVGTI